MKNGNNVEYMNEYSNLRSAMRKHILSKNVTNIQSWCIYFFATKHNFRFIPSPPKATFALLCPKTCQRGKSCNSQSLHVSSVLTYSSKDAYEYELRSRTKILYSMNWIFRKRTWIKKEIIFDVENDTKLEKPNAHSHFVCLPWLELNKNPQRNCYT